MSASLARASASLVLIVLPFQALGQAGNAADPVVAVVNGAEIHRSDVVDAQARLPAEYQSYSLEEVFPALLDRLIDAKLIAQAGRTANLPDDADVKKRLALLEDQVIGEAYLVRHLAEMTTDEALRQRYDEFLKLDPPRQEVSARHILLQTEAEARAVIERLEGGADFAEVAKEESSGPSAPQGGDIGYFTRDQMVPEFAEAAFALETGAITEEPVKTQFGWHVIKVQDKRLAAQPGFEEKRDELVAELSREVIGDLIERLRDAASIETFNPDGTTPEAQN